MPTPVSRTVTRAVVPVRATQTSTRPPDGVNLSALSRRLMRRRSSHPASPLTITSSHRRRERNPTQSPLGKSGNDERGWQGPEQQQTEAAQRRIRRCQRDTHLKQVRGLGSPRLKPDRRRVVATLGVLTVLRQTTPSSVPASAFGPCDPPSARSYGEARLREPRRERAQRSEPRERSEPTKRLARARLGSN